MALHLAFNPPFMQVLLVIQVIGCGLIVYLLGTVIYNLWFHPLASYPGPFLARCSRLWYFNGLLHGRQAFAVHRAHQKYGDIVRIAPDELACINVEAWKDIYGYRPGKRELPKDPKFYGTLSSSAGSIMYAPGERHGQLRRLLSHGFSDRAMREQEQVIQHYISTCMQRLHEHCGGYQPVDMVQWYNFFTFDVISDLAFGESFSCLANSSYHPWVSFIFRINRTTTFFRAAAYYKSLKFLVQFFMPKQMVETRKKHLQMSRDRAIRRWEMHTERTDLVSGMTDPNSGVTMAEFISNASTLTIAGSDTTSTVLSGTTYYLVKNPEKLQRLTREVRSAFSSEDEININTVNGLPYLLACLNEGMRVYPPIVGNIPRRTNFPEEMACGLVPANTTMSIFNYAMCHSAKHFTRPDDFIPERWLDETPFKTDNNAVVQPFSIGTRNCLGRNLAYFEMRLFLARLLFNFDLEWTPACVDWEKQQAYSFWIREPLLIKLKPVLDAEKSRSFLE